MKKLFCVKLALYSLGHIVRVYIYLHAFQYISAAESRWWICTLLQNHKSHGRSLCSSHRSSVRCESFEVYEYSRHRKFSNVKIIILCAKQSKHTNNSRNKGKHISPGQIKKKNLIFILICNHSLLSSCKHIYVFGIIM